jgi:citrate lyase subunit beta/citryl-CoA lyase
MVRVNIPGSEWIGDDLAEGLAPGLAAVMVPKVERIAELDAIGGMLESASREEMGVFVGVETALGVADARSLLSHPLVVGAYFGAEDFVADMGGVRTEHNHEVAFARAGVALAARLAGIPVVDQVVADFSASERFTREATEARALGFTGKLCIHPSQVQLSNTAFTPSDEEVDRARRMIAAYEEAIAGGIAAIAFEGQMIDEALVRHARRVVTLAS